MIINKFPIGNNNKKLPGFTYTGTYTVVDDGNDGWRIKFLTSGTLRVDRRARIDVFLVGGGASGSYCYVDDPDIDMMPHGGGGGGSGYTLTKKNIDISNSGSYIIIVGDGGQSVGGGQSSVFGNNGGNTSAFGYTANGGSWAINTSGLYTPQDLPGNGGSAGGQSGTENYIEGSTIQYNAENGLSDGDSSTIATEYPEINSGKGQGTTTKEFGEITGALYAGGGGGGAGGDPSQGGTTVYGVGGSGGGGNGASRSTNAGDGAVNTGGGGGGGHFSKINGSRVYKASGAGGSGIVIIRNHRGN